MLTCDFAQGRPRLLAAVGAHKSTRSDEWNAVIESASLFQPRTRRRQKNNTAFEFPMQETYIRFTPVTDVVAPCAYIVLCTEPGAHTVRLSFSNIRGAPALDLLVHFDSVMACMSHTEFSHPCEAMPITELPRLEGKWDGYAFPLLEVRDSQWLALFTDSQTIGLARNTVRHFRFLSLDNLVDVLMYSDGVVTAEWVATAPPDAPEISQG